MLSERLERGSLFPSAIESVGERDHVIGDDIPILLRGEIDLLMRPMLARARHEYRLESARSRGGKIVVVGRHKRDLAGRQIEQSGAAEISLRLWLVSLGWLRAGDDIPWQLTKLRHPDHQTDVAVRDRSDDKALL